MQDRRGALVDFMKYGLVLGVVFGLAAGASILLLVGGSSDGGAERSCEKPPSEFDWNSTQPGSAKPVQTLSGNGSVTGDDGSTYRIEYSTRRTRNSSVFAGVSHDNQLIRYNGTTYLLSQYHCAHLFATDKKRVPMKGDEWTPVRSDVFYRVKPPGSSVDTMLHANGTWYAYYNRTVATSGSLHGNWTWRTSLPQGIDDIGVYYENDRFHMFYEAGNTSGLSGTAVGYATSPNGVTNWTVHEPVYRSETGYRTGDYEVVEHDGVYLVFADYSRTHPEYEVGLYATPRLGANLTRVGSVAVPFRDSMTQPEHGIQDPTVLYDETREQFVLYAHVHEQRRRLHAATLDVTVQRGAVNATAG